MGVATVLAIERDQRVDQTGTTLYEHVDPDALDALVGNDTQTEVTFVVDDRVVVVQSSGTILVSDTGDGS